MCVHPRACVFVCLCVCVFACLYVRAFVCVRAFCAQACLDLVLLPEAFSPGLDASLRLLIRLSSHVIAQ